MLTTDNLHVFLKEISHTEKLQLKPVLDLTCRLLAANLLLENTAGKPLYQAEEFLCPNYYQSITIPIIHCGQKLGQIQVFKPALNDNELVLLEMIKGILACNLNYSDFTS